MEWKIELTGNESILRTLSNVLSNDNLSVVEEGESYILICKQFNLISNHVDVKTEVEDLLKKINSSLKLLLNSSENIDYKGIYYVDINGDKQFFSKPLKVELTCRYDIELIITHPDGTTDVYDPAKKLVNWIKISSMDVCVEHVFDIINYDFNSWVALYKIIEVLEKEDKYPPVRRNGKYYKELKRLKHTANSYQATKNGSRHAHKNTTPPENPMLLAEAISLIKIILNEWIDEKSKGS